jgi:16S rRNA C967 or C1407 C5-methylase (RsmB/RsmF family)
MVADTLRMRGSVTGVDFSRPRIGACRQLVHKYRLVHGAANGSWRCRLFHADGRIFSVGPTSDWGPHAFEVVLDSDEVRARDAKSQSRKRKNKSARAREAKRLKGITAVHEGESVETTSATAEVTPALYDKVLVDAECTHDGSIKHLQKLQTEEAWHAYVRDHLNDAQIKRILALQQALITNGFALLREGGTMIYSTCSLSIQQNEDIVRRFLEMNADAHVVPIDTTGIPCEVRVAANQFASRMVSLGVLCCSVSRES